MLKIVLSGGPCSGKLSKVYGVSKFLLYVKKPCNTRVFTVL